MPSFYYKAKKNSAETVTGRLDAQNQDEALDFIQQMNLVPVSLEEVSQGVLVANIRPRRIKPKEIYHFTKQLGSLIKSGVTLLKALEVISEQIKNPYLAKIMSDIAASVKSGRSFSASLAEYPGAFSPLYVSMIQAGEEIGNLKEVLLDIADFQKRQQEIITKVSGAMVYPFVMLAVGSLTVIFILTFVLPKIAVIYADTAQTLPLPTLVVMKLSSFFKAYWIIIVVAIATGVLILNKWRRTGVGQVIIGQISLNLPLVKDLIIKTDLARFTRTLQLLLASGLTLIRSIEATIPTITNPQLREDLTRSFSGLRSGESMASCLGQSFLLPDMVEQMLTVAEESGSLQESLKDIAESYEADINENIRVMTTLLEPIMILLVGVVVGFIIFAMLMPIFSMDLLAR